MTDTSAECPKCHRVRDDFDCERDDCAMMAGSANAREAWSLSQRDGYSIVIGLDAYGDRTEIATLYNTHPQEGGALEEWHPPQAANARLIAAAPDMLAALEDIAGGRLNATDAMLANRETLMSALATYCQERARAAIAKATGAAS